VSKAVPRQRSKKHHYVAKGILKNFCIAGDMTLYASKNRNNGRVEQRNIGTIFTRRHYNSYTKADGSKDDTVERFFAYELDNLIPEWLSIFETSLKSNKIEFNSNAPRQRFVQFFYNHTKRSPDFIEPIVKEASSETFHEDFEKEFREKFGELTKDELAKLHDPSFREAVLSNSRVHNFGTQTVKILDTLNSLKLFVATPQRKNKEFICGANPVARFGDHPFQKLGEKGVELWTTLTPKIAVGFANNDASHEVIAVEDQIVRKMNLTLVKQSSSIAGRSQKLLESLVKAAW